MSNDIKDLQELGGYVFDAERWKISRENRHTSTCREVLGKEKRMEIIWGDVRLKSNN
jgi:hypothetical protein